MKSAIISIVAILVIAVTYFSLTGFGLVLTSPGGGTHTSTITVLLMQQDAVATMLVRYHTPNNFTISISPYQGWLDRLNDKSPNLVLLTLNGSSFQVSRTHPANVSYALRSMSGSSGYYELGFTDSCAPTPLVVGIPASQVTLATLREYYPEYFTTLSCPNIFMGHTIISMTNVTTLALNETY